jgi:hypothetical protein
MQEKAVKSLKTRASPSALVYQKVEQGSLSAEDFELPVEGKLAADNRWVILAQLIPWAEFEEEYAQNFEAEAGPPAKSFRLALGALIIKEKLGISDRSIINPTYDWRNCQQQKLIIS